MDNQGNGDTIVLHHHSSRHLDQSLPARKESEIVGSAPIAANSLWESQTSVSRGCVP